MSKVNGLAAVCAMLIFAATFFFTGYSGLFVNAVGLTVVLSGTLGAVFLSYSARPITVKRSGT